MSIASPRVRAWVGPITGITVLGALLWRVGAAPFLEGIRGVDEVSVVAALAITALTTWASAWRWVVVARGLGLDLTYRAAVAAYYRSQFLNTVLPGGVLGDVERAVRHGRSAGDVRLGLRVVAWERTAGQAVQLGVAAIVLLVLPSPARAVLPTVLVATLGATFVVASALAVAARRPLLRGRSRRSRVVTTVITDLRQGLLSRPTWPPVLLASVLVVAGHVSVFVLAVRVTDATLSLDRV
ncbi:MAG: lysylphosphatidylglycerol synthase domain-containing protein, partial [Lapillicoccus sp.]